MKTLHKTFTRQHDQSDCGVATLLSVIRFHCGTAHLEQLRELSGTSRQGTTLLGIFQAAQKLGLTASVQQAEGISNLQEYLQSSTNPCILHIVKEERLQHYVVCYGYDAATQRFTIGDPALGITSYSHEELDAVWRSNALLILQPNSDFILANDDKLKKQSLIWEFLENDATLLFVTFALGIIIAVLSLSTAIFSQKLVDTILPKHDTTRLWLGLGMLLILLIARNGLNFLRGRFVIRQTFAFNNRITNRFFSILLRLPQPFFDNRKIGDLTARMNNAHRLQQALTYLVGEVMIDVLLFIVSVIVIFLYSVPIGAFLLATMMFYGVLAWRFHAPIVQGQRNVMAAYGLNESNYVDTIQGIASIKSSGSEEYFATKTRSIYGLFQKHVFELGKTGTNFNFASEMIGMLAILIVLGWSSLLVLQGALLTGALVAIVQMAGQLNSASLRIALTNIRLQEARIAFERMYAFASVKPEVSEENTKQQHPLERVEAVSLQNISFRFAGRPELLKNALLHLERGTITALMGESGSGKTTILQMLQRFYAPESGSILVNGDIPLEAISLEVWRRKVSVVPQHIKVFNATVLENICLQEPTEVECKSVVEFCQEYGFEKYIAQFPQGYATLIGEEGVNLSGGQLQMLALARALYKRPDVLLLDEATSAMDKRMEADIWQLLHSLKSRCSILFITHNQANIDHADNVYILQDKHLSPSHSLEFVA
ncbi:MAG: peptidase domain-containing ABC transporter [Candidatus Kapaibacterium sp.]|nr:MAG: peptidase domain-containing ABC transporter [Candidatus Kapabacteria bacterium]